MGDNPQDAARADITAGMEEIAGAYAPAQHRKVVDRMIEDLSKPDPYDGGCPQDCIDTRTCICEGSGDTDAAEMAADEHARRTGPDSLAWHECKRAFLDGMQSFRNGRPEPDLRALGTSDNTVCYRKGWRWAEDQSSIRGRVLTVHERELIAVITELCMAPTQEHLVRAKRRGGAVLAKYRR